MDATSHCDACGAMTQTRYAQFRQAIGLLIAMRTSVRSGNFCARCARKLYLRTTILNMTLGWASIMSVFVLPAITIHNVICYRRLKRQFNALASLDSNSEGSVAGAIQSLPWASAIGVEDLDVGRKPLTFPIAAVGLTGVAMSAWTFLMVLVLVLSIIGPLENPPAYAPKTPEEIEKEVHHLAEIRHGFYVAFPFVVFAFAGSVYWRYKSESAGDGDAPDVLAELFPTQVISQVGGVQVVSLGLQAGSCFRLIVCAQNLYDQATTIAASIGAPGAVGDLACILPAAGVCISVFDWPLNPLTRPCDARLTLRISTSGNGGARVRPRQRRFFSSESRDNAFDLARALAGSGELRGCSPPPLPGPVFFSEYGTLETLLVPFQQLSPSANELRGQWKSVCFPEANESGERSCSGKVAEELLALVAKDARPALKRTPRSA